MRLGSSLPKRDIALRRILRAGLHSTLHFPIAQPGDNRNAPVAQADQDFASLFASRDDVRIAQTGERLVDVVSGQIMAGRVAMFGIDRSKNTATTRSHQ